MRRLRHPAAALVAAACAFPAVALAGATKKIEVGDDYYGPTKVTVKKGTTIKWTWLDDNGRTSHDVKLLQGPGGRQEVPLRVGGGVLHVLQES